MEKGKITLEAVLLPLSLPLMVLKKQLATALEEERKFLFFFFHFGNVCVCVYYYTYETGGCVSSHHPNQEILTSVGLETVSQNLH